MGSDPAKSKNEQRNKVDHTLKSFIDDHYSTWAKANHADGEATIARLKAACGDLLSLPLMQIDALRVEKWRNKRAASGATASTINRDLTALKAAINRATDWGLIESHTLSKVKASKVDSSKIVRYLSADEESALNKALGDREEKMRQERDNANVWRTERGYELYAAGNR